MALFRSHDDKLLWSLTKAIRLLLPADPGFDRMRGADRDAACAVGAMGLGLATATGGVCVDVFGFRVRDPGDLVIRAS